MSLRECKKIIRKKYGDDSTVLSLTWNPYNLRFRCPSGHVFTRSWNSIKNGHFCSACNTHSAADSLATTFGIIKPIITGIIGLFTNSFKDLKALAPPRCESTYEAESIDPDFKKPDFKTPTSRRKARNKYNDSIEDCFDDEKNSNTLMF